MPMSVIGKKIELKPVKLEAGQVHCQTCGGVGWLQNDDCTFITQCPDCIGGRNYICKYCGEILHRTAFCNNKACLSRRESEREKQCYEKAIKIKPDAIVAVKMDAFFSDYYPYNEGYFTEWEDFFEKWADEHQADEFRPAYVWGTVTTDLHIDAGSLIEWACEELHEDASQNIRDITELQSFLDYWCKKQTGTTTYTMSYKYAIEIPWDKYGS